MSTEHHNGFRPSSAAVMAEEEVRFGPTGKIETVTEHVNDGVPAEDSEEPTMRSFALSGAILPPCVQLPAQAALCPACEVPIVCADKKQPVQAMAGCGCVYHVCCLPLDCVDSLKHQKATLSILARKLQHLPSETTTVQLLRTLLAQSIRKRDRCDRCKDSIMPQPTKLLCYLCKQGITEPQLSVGTTVLHCSHLFHPTCVDHFEGPKDTCPASWTSANATLQDAVQRTSATFQKPWDPEEVAEDDLRA
eukprot:m.438318 g.438318  ORF g.438318 m.438318 type:complete len:249 (-) comp20274_c3_seq25:49-795(-)